MSVRNESIDFGSMDHGVTIGKKRLAARQKVLKLKYQFFSEFEHLEKEEEEDFKEKIITSTESETFTPNCPLKKENSSSFKWKLATKSAIKTKRLFQPSNNFDTQLLKNEKYPEEEKSCSSDLEITLTDQLGKNHTADHSQNDLPISSTLQHLVKARPKRPKKYGPIENAVFL